MATALLFPEIDLKGVKGVLTDLDNTIYNFDRCHDIALEGCYELEGLGGSVSNFKEMYADHRRQLVQRLEPLPSCRSRALTFLDMMEARQTPSPYLDALRYGECYWDAFIAVMEIEPAALSFLKDCRSLDIPVCIITDMLIEVQIRKVKRLGIEKMIAHIVTSEEIGIEKPDKRLFEAALKKIGAAPAQAIMIGDSQEKDIAGAESCGIKTYKVEIINRKG